MLPGGLWKQIDFLVLFGKFVEFSQKLAWAVSLSSHLCLFHCASAQVNKTPPCLTSFHAPSPPHFPLSSSFSCRSPQTVSQSITRESLCVVFGRTLFSATICLLLLSLSVSLSLLLLSLSLSCRPCQSHPSEELFSASPLKILETLWSRMAVCRWARTEGCVCMFVSVCLSGVGGGSSRVAGREHHLPNKRKRPAVVESFCELSSWLPFCLWGVCTCMI